MINKLNMMTKNKADENFYKLAALFPNAVTETIDENGEVVRAIDKDILMQEISVKVVEGREERYQFTWPDKRKAIIAANAPSTNTLYPILSALSFLYKSLYTLNLFFHCFWSGPSINFSLSNTGSKHKCIIYVVVKFVAH